MSDPASYTHVYHAFRKARTYTLTGDALTWQDEGDGQIHRLPYADIREVRLAYRPSRVQRNRYLAHIQPKLGRRIDISNSSYVSLGNFAEHNAEYSAFLRELHRRLAASGSGATFHKGSSWIGFIGNVLLTVFIFAMVAFALFMLTATGIIWIAIVKLAIIAFFIPTLIRFILRSRPQGYAPSDIPADALPA